MTNKLRSTSVIVRFKSGIIEMNIFEDIALKYPKIVRKMCLAAIVAGEKILEVYSSGHYEISTKQDNSPVTLADKISDKVIGNIISEESYVELNSVMNKVYFLVDPLDGTKEFLKKTGEFTVNIALILNSKAELGVVYVPVTGELYYRDINGMSYLERVMGNTQKRSDCVHISCRPVDMENLSVVKSVSHSTPETEAYIAKFAPNNSQSAGSSLKFGLIASGRADFYPRLGRTMGWDTGAAHAVLKGAGGNVWRLDTLEELSYGHPRLENPFFVAASNDMKLITFHQGR